MLAGDRERLMDAASRLLFTPFEGKDVPRSGPMDSPPTVTTAFTAGSSCSLGLGDPAFVLRPRGTCPTRHVTSDSASTGPSAPKGPLACAVPRTPGRSRRAPPR